MATTSRRARSLLLAAIGAIMLAGMGGCSIHAGCRGLSLGWDWIAIGGHGHGHGGWSHGGCR